jgi:adenylate cyclase class 2
MSYEIEAKIRVNSFDQLLAKLKSLGAEFLFKCYERDTYFDDSAASMFSGDKAVRFRQREIADEVQYILTFKGPRVSGEFKKRKEYETQVSDGQAVPKMLAELGLCAKMKVEKHRENWRYCDCVVSLDEVDGLGKFVEIEGQTNEQVSRAVAGLGLNESESIQDGYASLLSLKG